MTTNHPSIANSTATESVNTGSDTTKSEQTDKSISYWWLVGLGFISFALITFYYFNFGYRLEMGFGNQADFGAFGDFLGGVLNPILGFATVGLLIWSLKMQRDELTLTRQELKETKEETALSRQALQEQVEHLQKEAKLNEALRIIGDLRTHISIVSSYTSVLSLDVIHAINSALCSFSTTADDVSRLSATSIHDLLYGEKKAFFEQNVNVRIAFKKQYNLAIQYSEHSPLIEVEDLLLQFSTVAIFYYQESHNQELSLVYLLEAERLLTPFQSAVDSKYIKTSLENLKSLIDLTMNK